MRYEDLYINNATTLRDVYPSAMGFTTGNAVTATTGGMTSDAEKVSEKAVSFSAPSSNPLVGGVVFVALVVVLMISARYLGTDDEFKQLKPSVYNVITIALAAAAGLPLIKYLAVKTGIPSVRDWILAA
jgi:hypothetical protein